jgi:hypothetical protein
MKRWMTRSLYVVAALLVCAVLALPLLGWFHRWQTQRARKDWKEKAIPEISRLADDREWVDQEASKLAAAGTGHMEGVIAEGWLTDRMIRMRTGEWLVYKSHCSKAPPHNVRDIFLAKGSDGKWYYTTCHFCVGMVALLMMQEVQPSDLASFVRLYNFAEFDGKSDECLKETKAFPDFDEIEKANKAAAADALPRAAQR